MTKKLTVLNMGGKSVGEISLSGDVMKLKANPAVLHQAVRYHLAMERRGTASTKTRGEVSGGGVKPWRQKGTGRARAGSIRSPLWKGGGTVFGPMPRDFSLKLPQKVKSLALKTALVDKIHEDSFKVVDKLNFKIPSTKKAREVLDNLKAEGKILAVLKDEDENVSKSLRNIPEVKIIQVDQISTYDVLDSDVVVTTKSVFETLLKERLS
jgi:large subunit ribosomal protein L4